MTEGDIALRQTIQEQQARHNNLFLPEAHEAQNEALRHQVEQSRLLIFGALGAMAVVATAMFATDRKLCLPYIELGYVLLMLSTAAGWYANTILGGCWDQTASLKFTNLSMFLTAAEGRDGIQEKEAFALALRELGNTRNQARIAVTVGSTLAWLAFPAVFQGVRETVAEKCSLSVWDAAHTWLAQALGSIR